MACPLFIPTSRLPASPFGELVDIAAPLGDLYEGKCAANPSVVIEPGTLRSYCNFGHARGHCHYADQSTADAVRFLVTAASGRLVRIAWATEYNHHPVAVGAMDVDTATVAPPDADALTQQLHACAAAYMRQSRADPT